MPCHPIQWTLSYGNTPYGNTLSYGNADRLPEVSGTFLPLSLPSPPSTPVSRVFPSSLRRQRMRRNFSYHERLKAVAEVQAGKPLRAVASAMGCTPSAISKWMKAERDLVARVQAGGGNNKRASPETYPLVNERTLLYIKSRMELKGAPMCTYIYIYILERALAPPTAVRGSARVTAPYLSIYAWRVQGLLIYSEVSVATTGARPGRWPG